jgi:alkylated DNA repair dioxygenase AlkB
MDIQRESLVLVIHTTSRMCLMRQAEELFESIRKEMVYLPGESLTVSMWGKTYPLRCSKMFQGDRYKDLSQPFYIYTGYQNPDCVDWTPTLLKLRNMLTCVEGHITLDLNVDDASLNQFNTQCVVNSYCENGDYIGPHTDKTKSFAEGSNVMTLSFGATRTMRLTNISNNRIQEDIVLRPGSVILLSWNTNQEWKHEILPGKEDAGERISLTYRNIQNRKLVNGSQTRDMPSEWNELINEAQQEGEKHWRAIDTPTVYHSVQQVNINVR